MSAVPVPVLEFDTAVVPVDSIAADEELSLHSELAVAGYVNGLAFSKNASYLVAAVGQEPRLGRWGREKGSKNSLFIQRLKLTSS